jgi:hypothetical protein
VELSWTLLDCAGCRNARHLRKSNLQFLPRHHALHDLSIHRERINRDEGLQRGNGVGCSRCCNPLLDRIHMDGNLLRGKPKNSRSAAPADTQRTTLWWVGLRSNDVHRAASHSRPPFDKSNYAAGSHQCHSRSAFLHWSNHISVGPPQGSTLGFPSASFSVIPPTKNRLLFLSTGIAPPSLALVPITRFPYPC